MNHKGKLLFANTCQLVLTLYKLFRKYSRQMGGLGSFPFLTNQIMTPVSKNSVKRHQSVNISVRPGFYDA